MPTRSEFQHRFVPREPDGPPYTLLLLHGTGGGEDDLLVIGSALAPGAALLSPRGKVIENGMPRFFRRLSEGVFDIEDVILRAHELADFVEGAAGRYGFDPKGVVAAGYSNGANIAAAVLLLRPQTLAGAMLFHPMVPLEPAKLPDLSQTPVFLSGGRRDPVARPDETARLSALFGLAGADVALHWSGGGHELAKEEILAAKKWLSDGHAPRLAKATA